MVPANLSRLNWPITTEAEKAIWGSRHKCNRMKAIIGFSLNLDNANDNLRRFGYTRSWRRKAILNFHRYCGNDSGPYPFTLDDLSEISTPWWVCMPYTESDKPVDPPAELRAWIDSEDWTDTKNWGY